MSILDALILFAMLPALIATYAVKPVWVRFLGLLPLILVVLHWLFGAYRWQFLPIYVVSIAFGVIFLLRVLRIAQRVQVAEFVALLSGLIVIGVVAQTVITGAILLPVLPLPEPTGPSAVGTQARVITDADRSNRQLLMQIWYPTDANDNPARALYMGYPDVFAAGLLRDVGLPGFLYNHLDQFETASIPDAPMATAQPRYPVVIFSHGLRGVRTQNTLLMQELASHGYIAVAIDHSGFGSGVVFPDGERFSLIDLEAAYGVDMSALTGDMLARYREVIDDDITQVMVEDARFVIDAIEQINGSDDTTFGGRLDLTRLGLVGHALGGSAHIRVCAVDARCHAVINLDGLLSGNITDLTQPALFMHSAETQRQFAVTDEELAGMNPGQDLAQTSADHTARWRQYSDRLVVLLTTATGPVYNLVIAETASFDYTDLPLFGPPMNWAGLSGAIDPPRMIEIVNTYSRAFLDTYLKDEPAALLGQPSPEYTEVDWIFVPSQ
ncbi:MAG: hypothetical protein GYB67_04445 [Chloroflexi bacterium]|nr:hypothetical protein [Chloroflexota bacterium]